jgi:hypothetical protein
MKLDDVTMTQKQGAEVVKALLVMVLTPHILSYLQDHDPMALLQAKDALKAIGVDPEPDFQAFLNGEEHDE